MKLLTRHGNVVRYLMVGGLAFLIEMSCIYVLRDMLHTSAVGAVAVSFWIGLVAGFLLQKYLTFANLEHHPKVITRQIFAYAVLVSWNYGFSLLMVHLLESSLSVFLIRLITMAIIVCWNYTFYAKLFRKSEVKLNID